MRLKIAASQAARPLSGREISPNVNVNIYISSQLIYRLTASFP